MITLPQAECINKFNELLTHFQQFGENALPPGVWECHDHGPWNLLRQFYRGMLSTQQKKEFDAEKSSRQTRKRDQLRAARNTK